MVIDAPWSFSTNPSTIRMPPSNRGFQPSYSLLSLKHLEQLPVAEFVQEGGLVFLWVIQCQLPNALKLLEKWQLTLIDTVVWIKSRHNSPLESELGNVRPNRL